MIPHHPKCFVRVSYTQGQSLPPQAPPKKLISVLETSNPLKDPVLGHVSLAVSLLHSRTAPQSSRGLNNLDTEKITGQGPSISFCML